MLISELWQINFQTFIRCFHWVKNIKQNKNAYHEMSMTEFPNKSWNTTSGLINDVNWKKKNVYPKLIQKYVYIQDTKHHWSSYHVPGRTSWMVRLQTSCNLYMESTKTYFNSAVVTVYFLNLYWSHFSVITIDLPEKLTTLTQETCWLTFVIFTYARYFRKLSSLYWNNWNSNTDLRRSKHPLLLMFLR